MAGNKLARATWLLLAAALWAGPVAAQPAAANDPTEKRVRTLHDRLHITAAQQAPWDAFADVMRANARHVSTVLGESRRAPGAELNAVEDMRAYARLTQTHAEDVRNLVGPFEALYATMSPDQKRLADQAMRDFQNREGRYRGRRG